MHLDKAPPGGPLIYHACGRIPLRIKLPVSPRHTRAYETVSPCSSVGYTIVSKGNKLQNTYRARGAADALLPGACTKLPDLFALYFPRL